MGESIAHRPDLITSGLGLTVDTHRKGRARSPGAGADVLTATP
ncbi:hypothetical protein [Nocardiopsis lambiniae]|uniref:Uncharacterized protein n=1 Tax=Nocardiopsis lambiniae TaxID=3075539 RepID=A0ABU2MAS6_9ACTN|nr:hypothetical protein [Nocardiopsis sp. DSM 44743]MDT0329061.1 hypothetical protein [Nocardiopsis sp. DSM 44743]